jgi:hypothetical protein
LHRTDTTTGTLVPQLKSNCIRKAKHSGDVAQSVSLIYLESSDCDRRAPGCPSGGCRDLHGPSALHEVPSPAGSGRNADDSNMHLQKAAAPIAREPTDSDAHWGSNIH